MTDQSTEYYAGWGTLALVNAGLAQGKGRSGLGWFLLSIPFGPIATLLIVLLDRVALPTSQEQKPKSFFS
ncbi:MAG: hypothetical protein ABMA26_04115 [Limisphaerales bacterium]